MKLSNIATRLDTCCSSRKMKKALHGYPSRTRDDIKFFTNSRVQIRYRELGTGQPIYFCADPPITLETYDHLISVYAQRFRVIVFELPGMGFSVTEANFDYSFYRVVAEVSDFVEKTSNQPAILAFSCAAGLSAVNIAHRRPDLVRKLVLIQTPSWPEALNWKRQRDPKGILAKPIIGQIAMYLLKHYRLNEWLDKATGNRHYFENFFSDASNALKKGASWAMASAFQQYLPDSGVTISTIDQPLLALWGELDQSHLQTDKSATLLFSKNSELQIYNDAGHFLDLEQVEKVYKDILEFAG